MPTRDLAIGTRVKIKGGEHAQRLGALIKCPAIKGPEERGYFVFLDGEETGPYTAHELEVQVFGA